MIWVVNAEYVENYRIKITFNDGLVKIVDLSEELDEGVFAPLRDIDTFKRFHNPANTIEWENGADFTNGKTNNSIHLPVGCAGCRNQAAERL